MSEDYLHDGMLVPDVRFLFPMTKPEPKITYSVESWSEMYHELEPFVQPHWEELGLDHIDVPVDFDWARYLVLDEQGLIHIVCTRDDGKLIGYHISIVNSGLHYKSTIHAMVDLYYLKPEYRKSKIGVKMFQFAERALKTIGVKKIVTGTKIHLNHSALFGSLGYKNTEVTFTKVLS